MSAKGAQFLAAREGVVLVPYRDSQGVWTIGVGHTKGAKEMGSLTFTQAMDLFRSDLEKYGAEVSKAIRVKVKQHEFDALVSFHFNTGGIERAKLTKSINEGAKARAALEFMGWTKPKEIIGRRLKEQTLFSLGDYGEPIKVSVWTKWPGKPSTIVLAKET